jgi:hypothetical protein
MNQSITSSIDENSEISTDIYSKRILLKHVSTISIQSIEEKIESDSALIKNYEYDDETFDSSTKSSTKTSSSTSLFESITSDLNETKTSTTSTTTTSSFNDLNQLKKNNYIEYVRLKIKKDQEQKSKLKHKFHSKQINKLIEKVLKRSKYQNNSNDTNRNLIKIQSDLINRIQTKNLITKIKLDQLEKVENFGNNLHLNKEELERAYYKLKYDQFKYNKNKFEFEQNEKNGLMEYDGIIKIGNLAHDLPKLTDHPDLIWNQLLKPLYDLKLN